MPWLYLLNALVFKLDSKMLRGFSKPAVPQSLRDIHVCMNVCMYVYVCMHVFMIYIYIHTRRTGCLPCISTGKPISCCFKEMHTGLFRGQRLIYKNTIIYIYMWIHTLYNIYISLSLSFSVTFGWELILLQVISLIFLSDFAVGLWSSSPL